MEQRITTNIVIAHDSVVELIRGIPDEALDWRPSHNAWSIKQIVGHLAHANDFYVMIVGEVRATYFGNVHLHPDLVGWQQMATTDAKIASCITTSEVLNCFEHTYHRMLEILNTIQPDELDQPFIFWQPDKESYATTLRQRVIQMAANHINEHQLQLSDTLARISGGCAS
jgi:hypothetical protein